MKKLITVLSKGTLPFIIAFSALSVSASAAFYSVSGLSKLFAGASFEVIVMAGSLEVAKLVTASLLYQYWNKINKILRIYLTAATIVLVLITSMGIYGFLSAAYQETYQKLSINENRIEFLDQKREFYQQDVTRYDDELARISENISTLSNARATSIQVRDTTSSTGVRNTISTAELRLAQNRIEVEEQNRRDVQARREVASDSLQKYQLEILNLENDTEIAGELGPLQYLSGLTGTPMDRIINWLLLVIIFVFDPLAISLVVAANFAFAQAFPKKDEKIPIPDVFEDDEFEDWDEEEILPSVEEIEEEIDETDYLTSTKANEERLDKSIKELENKIINNDKLIIEKQQQENKNLNIKIDQLETELDIAHEEINELDRAALQIVDSIKHIDDYLKHHAPYYDKQGIKWDELKLGFAEESDYINNRKPRSKPKGKDENNIITY
jgi:hypothetical protein